MPGGKSRTHSEEGVEVSTVRGVLQAKVKHIASRAAPEIHFPLGWLLVEVLDGTVGQIGEKQLKHKLHISVMNLLIYILILTILDSSVINDYLQKRRKKKHRKLLLYTG